MRPSAPLHLIFAIGILPLILGAMTYFVPVLTRSRTAEPQSLAPTLLALIAGSLVSFSLFYSFSIYPYAAITGLIAVIWQLIWIRGRKRAMLGNPHPGLLWYQLALGALLLGLVSILAGYFMPDHWAALRRFHLHVNILGFIGFTALGTLRVLLPTTGSYPDPQAGVWLLRQWPWLVGGTLLIAIGAAWYSPLALFGLIVWLIPMGQFLLPLITTHRLVIWQPHGATTPLACAVIGLLILLLSGGAHSLGWLSAPPTTQAFIPLFLLPLVTGASSHLLPLWMTQAQQRDRELQLRILLGRHSAGRSALFMLGGLLILAEQGWGLLLILVGLLHYIIRVVMAFFYKTPQKL
ncbi:hypothetical protein [Sedimenticola selenatireducens]|uniref:NnrS family protein n=1 Tax=Sedimenticola selenatireducens TaxID=191960 RepID=A0A558DXE1_9GAMM|nr:hypothetical protein [Sedimenticola selenatireducens]TVO70831.1 hypothetical protein FHP88_15345 [Sedimenticola selenatireducens]TVT65751.1 MAG: hypothetical protein FHK78_03315 [Sedimenticola selenatireducens]